VATAGDACQEREDDEEDRGPARLHAAIVMTGRAGGRVRMISPRMSRLPKLLATSCAVFAVALVVGACGSSNINVPKNTGNNQVIQVTAALREGAQLFNQRCSGCHSLSYAAAHGSAANVRSKQFNNGPNFDIRCERPVTRVLYAIQNGGFSGAIMPQNVVVGQQAIDVAKFVATYAGHEAPRVPGTVLCNMEPIGTIPAAVQTASTNTTATTTPATTSTSPAKTRGRTRTKSKATGSSKP
jgi:mono/diheme cytochrome c family protein